MVGDILTLVRAQNPDKGDEKENRKALKTGVFFCIFERLLIAPYWN